jgi:hypothetical protein
VDPHHSAPDESEVNWFQHERGQPDIGEPVRYPVPEPRSASAGVHVGAHASAHHAEPTDDVLPGLLHAMTGPIGPRSGQPLPPLPADVPIGNSMLETPHYHTQPLDRDTLRRARGGLQRLGDGVYRGRRPALAAVLSLLTVFFEVPVVRVFANSYRHISATGTISSILMILALPMFALGLYALAGGAAVAPGQGVRAWMRTPLAYLPMGLVLFLIAALAAA